jgi:hypothetical protein
MEKTRKVWPRRHGDQLSRYVMVLAYRPLALPSGGSLVVFGKHCATSL